MEPPRLSPVDETARRLRFAIALPFAQDPVRRFGQMPGHRPDGLRVTRAPAEPLVEATDMAGRRAPAREADRVRGFDECPLQVAIDIRTRWTESRVFPPLAWTRGVVPA